MSKVEQITVAALLSGEPVKVGNSQVEPAYDCNGCHVGWQYKLHGHTIAVYRDGGSLAPENSRLILSDAGWRTNTTRSRLNAILEKAGAGLRIVQRDFSWFIDNLAGGLPAADKPDLEAWEGSATIRFV